MDFVPGPFSRFRPDLPFNQRWEPLKPYLERLYLNEKMKLPEIVAIMKSQYGFDAKMQSESQYKHRFKSWKWKKNISTAKKGQICEAIQTRAAIGRSVIVKYKGVEIDQRKLRRYAKGRLREQAALAFPDGIMPPSTFREVSPISDIEVTTPSSEIMASPRSPSTLSETLSMRRIAERAQLFVKGRVEDLMVSMNSNEQKMTVQWLHQYYIFSYKTAKHWGWGPRQWSADSLGFYNSGEATRQMLLGGCHAQADQQIQPSQQCRWSIHLSKKDWDDLELISGGSATPDPEDESTWRKWPSSCEIPSFEQELTEALQTNIFSSLEENELPLSTKIVAEAADKSNELLLEALGFSIISRNVDLIIELIDKANDDEVDITSLYPYHLATTYLEGAETCCNILGVLLDRVALRKNSTNALGHTVLDNLMMTILKSHTMTSPGLVDPALVKEHNFQGEEVDICGRWDADSECYLALLATGKSSVPFEWKHKFCHTATQTICHSIMMLGYAEDLNSSSGIFLRYCTNCGLKLQLRPLHTLVLVAFQLAHSGCEGEDLFGALACLIGLLSVGVNPLLSADISLSALLDQESPGLCDHEELRPSDLAQRVPLETVNQWSSSARIGWRVFCLVLRHAQDTWTIPAQDEDEDNSLRLSQSQDIDKHFHTTCEEHHDGDMESCFGTSIHLGHIWAAVQAEFLSYRRLTEVDPWLSEYFSMESLVRDLETQTGISIGYIEHGVLLPYCRCGLPEDGWYWVFLREQLVIGGVSNMYGNSRGTFIEGDWLRIIL
ncbi:hypothetical protein BDZ45DRAFT_599053 [Acephala macrosclerotiorum]|nr:hypothetical protein BDZ45DRAFT_599053 [Acephala macrosclerotiorum]